MIFKLALLSLLVYLSFNVESPLTINGVGIKMEPFEPDYFMRYPISKDTKNVDVFFCFNETKNELN